MVIKVLGIRIFKAIAPPSLKEEAVTDIGDVPTRAIRTDLPHTDKVIIRPKEQRNTSEGPEWSTNNVPIFYSREYFQMYKVKLGVQGNATKDVSTIPTCRKNQTLPPQLGEINSGPVGPADNKRCPDRIHGHTLPKKYPLTTKTVRAKRRKITTGGNRLHVEEGDNKRAPRGRNQNGFYSNMFLVPKKDGKVRPVINLKKLNQFVHIHHFKMEGIQTARELVQPKDWMTKIDLSDAYFTIPVDELHQRYLRFKIDHQIYQFTCLPFGLSSAHWFFTKTLRPVAAKLREFGIRLVIYLDDILVIANSPKQSADHTSALIYTLENLGFIVHPEKSMTQPTQRVEFLGMIIDSTSMELQVPCPKIKKSGQRHETCYKQAIYQHKKCRA